MAAVKFLELNGPFNSEMFSRTFDQAKGLAILLVVLGHINSPVSTIVYSFHVPMFFFLAGVFIKTRYSGRDYLRKGLERLMVPFLIFCTVGFLATLAKQLMLGRQIEPWEDTLTGYLFWSDSLHMNHYGFVLWFLPALFWGRSFVFFAVKYLQWHPAILVGASVIVAWLAAHSPTLPWGVDKGLVALPWIMMGVVFYQYHERLLSTGWFGIVAFGISAALFVYVGNLQRLDLASKGIGNPLLSIPYTFSVIMLLIGALYRCGAYQALDVKDAAGVLIQFGQNSMMVLVLHVYTNNIMDVVINRFLGPGFWFVTFFMSATLVFTAIRIKRRYTESFVFKYL